MKIGEFELNKIYCMDCLEGLKKIPNKSIDIVISDPPYGMNFVSNHRKVKHKEIEGDDYYPVEIMSELFRITKKAIYLFARWDNIKDLPKPKSIIVWVKNNWSMGDLEHEHGRQYEIICFYPMDEHKFNKRIPDIIFADRTGNDLHPTQKPVSLIRELIKANDGQIILDPFIGSGTTAVACKQLNRNFIGFEISQDYVNIANKRIEQGVLNVNI